MVEVARPHKFNLLLFVILSLIIHLLMLSIYVPSTSIESVFSQKKVLKVKVLSDLSQNKPRQIVNSEKSKNKEAKDAQFLGKENNYFDRQTRAQKTGSFKKAGIGSKDGFKKVSNTQQKTKLKKNVKKISFSDLSMATEFKPVKKKNVRPVGKARGLTNGNKDSSGFSQSSDYLKDMELGDFTRLNTQEYEFYGFYNRIRIKLEQFWGRNIREQADKMYRSGRTISSDSNHITSLVIKLDSKGEIIKVNIKSASGVEELDKAAVESFNQAGPFPNPPKKMLKNGEATIEWSFVVNS